MGNSKSVRATLRALRHGERRSFAGLVSPLVTSGSESDAFFPTKETARGLNRTFLRGAD